MCVTELSRSSPRMFNVPRVLPALSITIALGLAVLGCSSTAEPQPQETVSVPTETEAPPEFVPGGSASDNEDYLRYVLRQSIRDGLEINGVNVVNTVVAAGFDRAAMQVSYDTSATGLPADNIFVSVRFNESCLLGQVVPAEKTVFTSVQPAVGPDKTVCLIGQTRPIDW